MRIQSIEAAAAAAWPPTESLTLGSWKLSAGDGFSRRRNSAVPAGPLPESLDRRLADVEKWYRVRGLPTLYRITPECDAAVDSILSERGLVFEAPTLVMSRMLDMPESSEGVDWSSVVTDAWVETEIEALGVDRSSIGPWLATIAAVPSPALFVAPIHDGTPAGAGFGVVVDGLLGVFEIVVRPEHRRRGHARRIMAALHRFGASEGASRAFLQVLEDDDRAITLYQSLGYQLSHRYWYRRADA
ncbi:MAG: GNAT family N-acetyltransferase [Acidimicrobiia bacterium]